MKRILGTVALTAAVLVGLLGLGAPAARAEAPAVPTGGHHGQCGMQMYSYSYSTGSCSVVPVSGTFTIQVSKRHGRASIRQAALLQILNKRAFPTATWSNESENWQERPAFTGVIPSKSLKKRNGFTAISEGLNIQHI